MAGRKLRMTAQRRAVLATVRRTGSHPSADEVYESVRRELPHVSLATVYRSLGVLSEAGLIREVELCGQPRRFDGSIEPHYHVRCTSCGRVTDVPSEPLASLEAVARLSTGYEVTGHSIEFAGTCPECLRDQRRPNEGGR